MTIIVPEGRPNQRFMRAEFFDTEGDEKVFRRPSLQIVGQRPPSDAERAMLRQDADYVVLGMRSGTTDFELIVEPSTAASLNSWLESRKQ